MSFKRRIGYISYTIARQRGKKVCLSLRMYACSCETGRVFEVVKLVVRKSYDLLKF